MVRTADLNFKPISFLQQEIMGFVHEWVIKEKIPVPQREILTFMKGRGHKKSTIVYSLHSLLRTGWIREAVTRSNRTEYVECRTCN